VRLWLKVKILSAYGRQRLFAKYIGKSEVWLSRVINGKVEPSDSEKRLIADMLEVKDYEALFIDTAR
jgi:hypothetical protein